MLLVEDEWFVRVELADAMAESGLSVFEAGSGEEALAMIEEVRPDLLVTDIRLSGTIDGWDVAEAYRAVFPDRPVIYASGNPQTRGKMVEGGVFLVKPSRTETLLACCNRLLRREQE